MLIAAEVLAVAELGAPSPARALQPITTYSSCSALNNQLPSGAAVDKTAASDVSDSGFSLPRVSQRVYDANASRSAGCSSPSGCTCARKTFESQRD